MYKNFFGFKERPFQLVPNPAYLYLSSSHEEAMAHLTYAISQGDGFVEITGEVGTGKTTICRAFIESLDENHEVAYIFNPKFNSIQLIKAINDEFGISSESDDIKALIDTLNSFLMEKKANGEKVILVIDEAQNLSKEVLEQLRLLSNLETNTSKLLQIILVGQPELGEMLDSHELRQLGQRITLSCHLSPLTYKEAREYIQHRIRIASQRQGIKFTRAAFRFIYKFSGGTPRLINIACDRTLLTAFGLGQHKITGSIARASIREIAGRKHVEHYSLQEKRRAILLLLLLCVALFMAILYNPSIVNIYGLFGLAESERPEISQPQQAKISQPQQAEISQPQQAKIKSPVIIPPDQKSIKSQKQEVSYPVPRRVPGLSDLLRDLDTRSSRHMALKVAMDLWEEGSLINQYLDTLDDDQDFFRLAAKQNDLLIRRIKGDLDFVKKLNLPAILEFYLPGDLSPRYLTLSKIDDEAVTLRGGGDNEVIGTKQVEIESYWRGTAYILWKHFNDYRGTIPLNAPKDSIITLKMLMKEIGFKEIEMSPFYDERTREAVKEIQRRHGLVDDGVVGPLTKIAIYNENKSLKIPHIANEHFDEYRQSRDLRGEPKG